MNKKGFGLVEIIVAATIISLSLAALAAANRLAFRVTHESTMKGNANFLLEEGMESIRTMRDISWATYIAPLVSGTAYYFVFDPALGVWGIAAQNSPAVAAETLFARTVTLGDVYRRNSDDDIVDATDPSPKTLDPNTKQVTITILWPRQGGGVNTQSLSTYITNLFGT